MTRAFGVVLLLVCAACSVRPQPLAIPEQTLASPVPETAPEVTAAAPRLVPYPGLDVSYVANAEGEVYEYRDVFYTYFDGAWFYAQRLRGPWRFIEMKYVPADLFRVRGHLPPSLQ